MQTIHKYELEITPEQTIAIPNPANFLDCQFQKGKIVFWAAINDLSPLSPRTFLMFYTGNELPFNLNNFTQTVKHIKTLQIPYNLVIHIFLKR